MYYISSYRSTMSCHSRDDEIKYLEIDHDEELFSLILENESFLKALFFSNPQVYDKLLSLNEVSLSNKKRRNLAKTLFNYYNRYYFNNVPNSLWAYTGNVSSETDKPSNINKIKIDISEEKIYDEEKDILIKVNPLVHKEGNNFYLLSSLSKDSKKWEIETTSFLDDLYYNHKSWISMSDLLRLPLYSKEKGTKDFFKQLIEIEFLLSANNKQAFSTHKVSMTESEFKNSTLGALQKLFGTHLNDMDGNRNSLPFFNVYKGTANFQISKHMIHDIAKIISFFTYSRVNSDAKLKLARLLENYYGCNSIVSLAELIKDINFLSFFENQKPKSDEAMLTPLQRQTILDINSGTSQRKVIKDLSVDPIEEMFSVPIMRLEGNKYYINLNKVANYRNIFDYRFDLDLPSDTSIQDHTIVDISKENKTTSFLQHHPRHFSESEKLYSQQVIDIDNALTIDDLFVELSDGEVKLLKRKNNEFVETMLMTPSLLTLKMYSPLLQGLLTTFGNDTSFRVNLTESHAYSSYLPRIEYKQFVIRKESWIYIVLHNKFEDFIEDIQKHIRSWSVPNRVEIFIDHNIMIINPYSKYHWEKLFSNIIVGQRIILSECLNTLAGFSGEYIVNFCNKPQIESKKTKDSENIITKEEIKDEGEKWEFYEVKVPSDLQNNLILSLNKLMLDNQNKKYHFLRYKDNDVETLRIRFKKTNNESFIKLFNDLIREYEYSKKMFYPELNRYGGKTISQSIYSVFSYDSYLVANLLGAKTKAANLLMEDALMFWGLLNKYESGVIKSLFENLDSSDKRLVRKDAMNFQANDPFSKEQKEKYGEIIELLTQAVSKLPLKKRIEIYLDVYHIHFNRLVTRPNMIEENHIRNTCIYLLYDVEKRKKFVKR